MSAMQTKNKKIKKILLLPFTQWPGFFVNSVWFIEIIHPAM
jgi:hypothetical protein